MKKRILNTIIASSLASLAVVGTSLAYYFKAAEDKSINVTLSSGSTDISFGISDITDDDSDNKLNPSNLSKNYSYKLSANKSTNTTYTQDVLVGSLKVTFKTKNETLFNAVTLANVIDYKNYSGSSEGTDTYFSNSENKLNSIEFTKADAPDSSGYYVISGTMDAPVSAVYGNEVDLTLALTGIDDSNFVSIAEAEYDINVVISENTTYEYAYLGGVGDLGWAPIDANRMVPNIYADKWQWMWKADKDYGASEIKAFKGEGESAIWSLGENKAVTIVSGDSVYWSGSTTDAVDFYHPTSA